MATDYDAIREEHIRGYGEYTHHLDLLGRLYADPTHFIFELLQNAEDAGATRVKFSLFEDRLEVLNDGRFFSDADVRGICAIGKGTKSDDLTQIGKFGIGFKSVYAHTARPQVHSGDEHFGIEYYVRPYAEESRAVPNSWNSLFVLPFEYPDRSFDQIRGRLRQLDTRTLLFLRNLREIEWSIEGAGTGFFIREAERIGESWRIRIIGQNGPREAYEEWLVFRRRLPADWYADPASISDERALRVEIAFLLEQSDSHSRAAVKRVSTSPLVVFFPTEKPTNLGFLIQGPYRTTPTRENVPAEDEWNRKLVAETATLLAQSLLQIREMGMLTVGTLETLPLQAGDFSQHSMFRPLFDCVSTLLRSERLIPAHDGSFASAGEAKLARGAELRDLITNAQLSELHGAQFKWLSGEITPDRTSNVHRYLTSILKIDEIDPESLARKIEDEWLERQSDDWTIRLYKFLHGQRALWRPSPYSPGLLRRKAMIRLEDGSHVAPFRDDGVANAYISPTEGTDLPTVKAALVADDEACAFLRDLGLKEPDPVAEIIERVVPRYAKGTTVSEQDHRNDFQKILTVLHQASQDRRYLLVEALKGCPFLRARNCASSITEFKKPGEIYLANSDTHMYFEGNPRAWLINEPTTDEKASGVLVTLGVKSEPRYTCHPNSTGYVILADGWGYHERGLNGFDRRCDIEGLRHALANINVERAQYIWNNLLLTHRRHVHGTVQSSSRQNYDPYSIREAHEYSNAGKLLTESPWLPDKSGAFRTPSELSLSDLPDAFIQEDELARAIGMKQSLPPGIGKDTLLREAGLSPEAARLVSTDPELIELLAQRPDELERIRKELAEQPEFPERSTPDRTRRDAGLLQRVREAPTKNYETRERSVRVSDSEALSQARVYLRDLYTNDADRMLCQACQEQMPFRLKDGKHYFEAVEYCAALEREIPENRLALCPTCAAKWLHAKDESPQELTTVIQSANSPELEVTLAGSRTTLRFVETHFGDLKVVLQAALAEREADDMIVEGI